MIIKTCVDCGAVILSNNVTARRCPVCAERFAERVRKKYKNPPADPLTADVRKADAAGKSYGYWRLDELLGWYSFSCFFVFVHGLLFAGFSI